MSNVVWWSGFPILPVLNWVRSGLKLLPRHRVSRKNTGSIRFVWSVMSLLCRYQGHLKEASFSIGLQGISGSDISTVKEIIWKTFSDISEWVIKLSMVLAVLMWLASAKNKFLCSPCNQSLTSSLTNNCTPAFQCLYRHHRGMNEAVVWLHKSGCGIRQT